MKIQALNCEAIFLAIEFKPHKCKKYISNPVGMTENSPRIYSWDLGITFHASRI